MKYHTRRQAKKQMETKQPRPVYFIALRNQIRCITYQVHPPADKLIPKKRNNMKIQSAESLMRIPVNLCYKL